MPALDDRLFELRKQFDIESTPQMFRVADLTEKEYWEIANRYDHRYGGHLWFFDVRLRKPSHVDYKYPRELMIFDSRIDVAGYLR